MGTNYYAVAPSKVMIHLGKQSAGWPFLFRAHEGWREHEAWKEWVATASSYRLEDEYGRDITLAELIQIAISSTVAHHGRLHPDAFRPDEFSMLQFMRGDFS